ncbi:MAG: hypothetical protein RLZZ271_30 [Pseudomonadota bacterium]
MAFAKTELGQDVLKNKTIPLSPRQRAMLIMADGKKGEAELLTLTAGIGGTLEDLQGLITQGLILRVADAPKPVDTSASVAPAPPTAKQAADFQTAYKAGVALTSKLGLRGFRLNLAMESAGTLDELKKLHPQVLEAMEKAHGPTMARQIMNEFDTALGF